ncbi:MAG: tetratricopeptide repeat protein [Treponema sp.]|nr:tetratricopeptide repeat protein [Treponema sp.]
MKKPEIIKKTALIFMTAVLASGSLFAIEQNSQKAEEQKPQAQSPADSPKVAFVKNLQNFLSEGNLQAAIASFDNLGADLKSDMGLMLIKGSLLISAGQPKQAIEFLEALEVSNPSNVDILEMKVVAYKAMGKSHVQAKKAAIQKVLAIDPNNATANVELGQEQVLLKKYKIARNYYQKALKGDPSEPNAIFGYGQTSYYMNDIEEARKAFKKMIELNPYDSIAWAYLGKLSAEEQNYKPAVEYVKKAIELEPAYDYYMDLGNYSRFLGRFADAEAAWTQAIKINPDYFLAYAYRGGLYDEQNKFDKALNDYRAVVRTNPDYYYAYESLGNLAWHEGQWEEARKAYEKAYSYNKENISYPLMISACWLKLKKAPMSKQFLDGVLKSYQDKKTLDYSMLRIFHDLGPNNAENDIALKIQKEDKMNKKGKMLFYFGLYYEIKGYDQLAKKYYAEVKGMQSPMFFEYRLAEWGLEK